MDKLSGVGVLDKAVAVLAALEARPASLAQLVEATGLSRPTAHRLAVALERHRLVARDDVGRFVLGRRLAELADAAKAPDRLLSSAPPVLASVRDASGESAQLYRRDGSVRVCVAAADRPGVGLRDSVPVGAHLSMRAGSAAQVLSAWGEGDAVERDVVGAAFTASVLTAVRRRGWASSVGEREEGVASVSAPVRDVAGRVVAALSISGPVQRLGRAPGRLHADVVVAGAQRLSHALTAP